MAATASADGPLLGRIVQRARERPDAPAVTTDDARVSYRHLVALVATAVEALAREGVRAGDVVAVSFASPVMTLVVLLALGRAGAMSVCLAPRTPPEERANVLRRFGVAHEICDGSAPATAGCERHVIRGLAARGDEAPRCAFTPTSETPFRLALTSGTTGVRKAVLQTHGAFVDRMERMQCGDMRDARVLAPRLHVTAGLNMAMQALCEGGCVVFARDGTPADFTAAMRRHRITHVGLPPANLAVILRELRGGPAAFPDLRHLRLMGATPSPALAALARERFTHEIYVPYGIGELGVVAMATPQVVARAPSSCGHVAPGATVEVLDASGAPCRPGETGALRVRLEGMPHAYWGPDAGDRSRFREGWFHPGDRGRVTPEGLLHVEGRADDIVNIGGRKAEPAYLERALEGHAHVEQAAVFALPDGDGAPALAAAIVPRPGLSWPALHAFALARLSTLAPTRYYEAAALPRGEMGKLARASLAARFAPCEPAFAARLFEVAP